MKCIIDSYAWVEYLDGTVSGSKVKEILMKEEAYTLILSIAEVISRAKRTGKNTDEVYNAISLNSRIINITPELSRDAGILHAEMRKKIKDFGLIDAFILLTARKMNAKIITGDEHFRGFKEAILIKN
jgi:predicted nucleic acid-binding protein